MGVPPEKRRIIGLSLVASAAAIFALSAAIWQGVVFELAADVRSLLAGALLFIGLTDLGLGIFFLRQSR